MKRGLFAATAVMSALAVLPMGSAQAAPTPTTLYLAATAAGVPLQNSTQGDDLSTDGRLAVVTTRGALLPDDTNAFLDVYLRDLSTGALTRVSTRPGGETDGHSSDAAISGDGNWVVFESEATNLVEGDTNGAHDVFLYEVATKIITRISVSAKGAQFKQGSFDPQISDDGARILYLSNAHIDGPDQNGRSDAIVYDRTTGKVQRASVGNDHVTADEGAEEALISGNGRFVLFRSDSTNLVPGTEKGRYDLYLRDLATKTTRLITASETGEPGNGSTHTAGSLSKSGRYVAFTSKASNLVPGDDAELDLFVFDLVDGVRTRIPRGNKVLLGGSLSDTGRFLGFTSMSSDLVEGDTNGGSLYGADMFVLDRQTGVVTLASRADNGVQIPRMFALPPVISGDGRTLLFDADAEGVVEGAPPFLQTFARRFRPAS